MQNKKFGAHLKKLRKTKGLTQKSLALKSGISLSYINKIENGKFDIPLTTLYSISLGLGVKPGKILEY